jgi:hypothetical protein
MRNLLLHEKWEHKKLVKSTPEAFMGILALPDVNSTNILQAAYFIKMFCTPFHFLPFGFAFFGERKSAQKMIVKRLVKLPSGRHPAR